MIEWTEDGYPTEESLQRLRDALHCKEPRTAIEAFYTALRANYFDCCGPERVEVNDEVVDVWGYHTLGWSGNEEIIGVLQDSWLWPLFLQRYDRGGHYYFSLPPWKETGV